MDLSKLFYVFVAKLEFDQDFKVVEASALNTSKYSVPRVCCAFGNVCFTWQVRIEEMSWIC